MDTQKYQISDNYNPFHLTKNKNLNQNLNNYKEIFNKINLIIKKPYKQLNYNISQLININSNNKDQIIFYWASDNLPNHNYKYNIINNFKNAHKNLNNYGITKINQKGKIKIYLQTPQIYYFHNLLTNQNLLIPKIVNFIFYNDNNQEWNFNEIYSLLIFPKFKIEKFIGIYKKKNTVIINCNSNFIYSTHHIPITFNLSNENINTFNESKLKDWFEIIIRNNYTNLNEYIINNEINLVPIIIYSNFKLKTDKYITLCYNLFKKGFYNISFFSGDLTDFVKHTNPKYDISLKKIKKKIYYPSIKNKTKRY